MRILAVGAHPDDVEINCMGTLARYVKEGHPVTIAHICTGDKGHTTIPPRELAEIRKREAQNAAAVIGAPCVCLEYPDGELYVNDASVRSVTDLLRKVKPDLIITHPPADYHIDHLATNKLVVDASFLATVPHYETNEPAQEQIASVYFMSSASGINFSPEVYVDITDTYDLKLEALKKHSSQIEWLKERYNSDLLEGMQVQSRFYGMQCGVQYAEGFQQLRTNGRIYPRRELP